LANVFIYKNVSLDIIAYLVCILLYVFRESGTMLCQGSEHSWWTW